MWAAFPVIKFLTHPTLVSNGVFPRPDGLTTTRKTANALVGLLARAWRHHPLRQGHTAKPHQLWIRSHLPTPQPQPCHGRAGSKGPSAFCLAGVSHPAPRCSLNTRQSRSWRPASHTRHTGDHKVQKKRPGSQNKPTTLEGLGLSRTLSFGCTRRAPNAGFCAHLQDSDPQTLDWDLPVLRQHRGHTLWNSGPGTISMLRGTEEDDQ